MQKNSKEIQTAQPDAYRFGDFEVIPSERQLRRRNKLVALPPKAFDALLIFVRNAERLVRRDELIESLWPGVYVTDTNLTNTIVTLRKVLGRETIQTVSKFGYRFCAAVIGEPGIAAATYATFLEAKTLASVRSLESMARARDLCALCVAQDPNFAAAWAWMGRCARFLDKFTAGSSVNLDLADAAFRRALAIDPDSPARITSTRTFRSTWGTPPLRRHGWSIASSDEATIRKVTPASCTRCGSADFSPNRSCHTTAPACSTRRS